MIIGSTRRYAGKAHRYLQGLEVQIIAIHRGSDPDTRQILTEDELIGDLRPEDLVEVAPFITANGERRPSWATSDTKPADLKECGRSNPRRAQSRSGATA